MKIHRINKKIEKADFSPVLLKEKKRLLRSRRYLKSEIPNPKVIRVSYVRYADDWLVGVWGPKAFLISLKSQIGTFLESLRLELSVEETLITNARSGRAKFLGTYIKRLASDVGAPKSFRARGGKMRRIPTGNLLMTAPVLDIVKRLSEKGYLQIDGGKWKPNSITSLIPLPVRDLILRYRVVLFGYFNYYSFVDNRAKLVKLHWILKESLRKTICRKLQIGKRGFLRRFGEKVQIKITRKDLK